MDTKTIDKRVNDIVSSEKELMLYRNEDRHLEHKWELHIGNPSGFVRLGEVDGTLVFKGDSIESILNQAEMYFLKEQDAHKIK